MFLPAAFKAPFSGFQQSELSLLRQLDFDLQIPTVINTGRMEPLIKHVSSISVSDLLVDSVSHMTTRGCSYGPLGFYLPFHPFVPSPLHTG